MIIFALICTSTVLWMDDFKSDTGIWVANQRNPVSISYFPINNGDTIGYVHIAGSTEDVGRSSAWLYVEKIPALSTASYVSLKVKGNGNLVRFRILFKNLGKTPYYYLQQNIRIADDWKEIKISFKNAHPIWSSNYPYALTPGLSPDFFLFVENGEPGSFSVGIDKIEVKAK